MSNHVEILDKKKSEKKKKFWKKKNPVQHLFIIPIMNVINFTLRKAQFWLRVTYEVFSIQTSIRVKRFFFNMDFE